MTLTHPTSDLTPSCAVLGAIPVRGASMWPSLRAEDRACLADDVRDVRVGEVVVVRMGRALVIHRVIKIFADGSGIQTRGDNCSSDDPKVTRAAILGRVDGVLRGGLRLSPPQWDLGAIAPVKWYLGVRRACARRVSSAGRES